MSSISSKVLVADDEESIRKILQQMLESIGYEVILAEDGREALYKLTTEEARIALLDVKMPNVSGMDVLKRLGNDIHNYCILMVTVVTDRDTAVDSLKLGAMDYITKPFDQSELIEKLYHAIEKYNRLVNERTRYQQLQASVIKQTDRMREQFNELIGSQAREHRLISNMSSKQTTGSKDIFGRRQEAPHDDEDASVDEFKDAVYRILRRKEENNT